MLEANTQASRTKVLSLTCTAAEEALVKRLAQAKEMPVAHLLRSHLDFDAIRAEYARLRSALGDVDENGGEHVSNGGQVTHTPKVHEDEYAPLPDERAEIGETAG